MPDLFALSLLVTGIYYLINILKKTSKKNNIILGIIISILCGVRISYIPFFIPIIFFISSNSKFFIFSFLITTVIWLTPFVYLTGINEMIELFKNDSYGHFYKWGGTIISSDGSIIHRFLQMFNFIFTDIFSFWSNNRHWSTIINSFLIIIAVIFSLKFSHTKFKKVNLKLLLSCFLVYFIWVLIFQNIQYKPRHLLPFIPLCCFIISMGINSIQKKMRYAMFFSITLVTIHAFITINIVCQHKHMSAISQIHNYLQQQKNNTIVVSDNLKLFYWKSHFNNKNIKYYSIDRFNQLLNENKIIDGTIVYSTILINPNNYRKINTYNFYHNPYVNRLWSSLTLNKYEKY